MAISYNSDLEIITVQVPASPSVIQVQLPGTPGPVGPQGAPGQASVLTIGTITTGAAGSNAAATISGVSPNQTLNLTIPRGNTGANGPANSLSIGTVNTLAAGQPVTATITGTAPTQTLNLGIPAGNTGPANTLTIGTVTTGASGSSATATITGTAPNQTLNLSIPQGIQGVQGIQGTTGSAGPANTLTIGTVTTGAAGTSASATITGTAPNQTLSLTIPAGVAGAANTLSIGTVTTGAAGTNASATITGTAPTQTLNLTIPTGPQGPAGSGAPDATAIAKGSVMLAGDLGGTAAAPTVPALANKANSAITISAGTGLTGGGDLTAARTLAVSYGSAAGTAVQGNDIRVTADQAATQASIRTIGTGALQAAAGNHTHTASAITDSTTVGRSVLTAIDAPTARTAIGAGTSSLVLGTAAGTAAAGNDGRLSDARTPTAHAATHATGGTDPITVAAIGAAAASHTHTAANISDSTTVGRSVLTAIDAPTARTAIGAGTSSLVIGTIAGTAKDGAWKPAIADISATGTPSATTYLRGDGTWSTPAGGSSDATTAAKGIVQLAGDLGGTAALPTVLSGANHTHTSAQVSDATSAATANMMVKRDGSGAATASSWLIGNAAPSATNEATRKDYVDGLRRPQLNSQTVSYTLVLADERKIVQVSSASATTVTVPPNSSVAFPVGTVVQVMQTGAGTVTLAPGAGVTLQAPMGLAMRQYQLYEVQKVATDTWVVYSNGNVTSSGGVNNIVQMTNAAYTGLGTKDANTLYVIVG